MEQRISLRDYLGQRIAALHDQLITFISSHDAVHVELRREREQRAEDLKDQLRTAFASHNEQHVLIQAARKEADVLHEERHRMMNEVRAEITEAQKTYVTLVEFAAKDHAFHVLLQQVRQDVDTLKINESKKMGGSAMAAAIFAGTLIVLGLIVAVVKLWH